MATTYDKASLVMIPSGYKDDKLYSVKPTDGSGDFTFSRDGAGASPATRVNASGLIEKGRENLLTYSNDFSNWTSANTTETSGQSGYDGTNDAWLLSKAASAGNIQLSVSTSGVNTFSYYAKAGTLNWTRLLILGSTNASTYINLSDGSIGVGGGGFIDATATSVGGGWYRVSITHSTAITQVRIYPADADDDTSGTSGNIYIQDAQLEQGLIATDVIETTTTAVSAGLLGDMPRLDYSGGATCPSLLLEPSRVNLVAYSEYFEGSGWNKSNAGTGSSPVISTNTNDTTSPEGEYNATKIVFDAGSGTTTGDLSLLEGVVAIAASTEASTSIWLKGENGGEQLHMRGVANSAFQIITLTTEWQQFTTTENSSTTTDSLQFGIRQNVSGLGIINSSATIYAYGAQIEVGSYPTSYIPTYGSASTRAQDLALKGSVSSLINDAEGTIFIEASTFENGADCRVGLSDNTINNRVSIEWDANADTLKGFIGIGGNLETTSYDQTNRNKIAITYDSTDARMYVNGTKVDTDTSVPTLSGMDRIDFSNYGAGIPFEGNAYQMLVFKEKLTDAEAIALTTL